MRIEIPSEWKTSEQNQLAKDAEELISAVNDKHQTNDEDYNLLVKDIKHYNHSVNKERDEQI